MTQFREDNGLGNENYLPTIVMPSLGISRPSSLISLNHGSAPDWMGTRVDGVHWLNFLGPPVLQELHGASALRSRLHSPETAIQSIDGTRAVVTLGDWPEAGALSRGNSLPAYRELGRVLEPWLDKPFKAPRFRVEGFTQEEAMRWARRFLD